MSKFFRPLFLSKNLITDLDDVFIHSQPKYQMVKVLDKTHQVLLKDNMEAAPDKSLFSLIV